VHVGTRMVVGKHRKAPIRLKDHIASYTLDNKASLAILLQLARRVRNPRPDVYLVASANEEVGAVGALYFTKRTELDALIALEICPMAPEYPIKNDTSPVLLVQDSHGVYDCALNRALQQAAARCDIPLQLAAISGFGSDGSFAMKEGHVARAACLGFPTQNTHGYEIAHLGAISRCADILAAFCENGFG
jgi:putative aminopeptidase FrvX